MIKQIAYNGEIMCGISGIISKNLIPIEARQLSRFFDNSLIHRGPDENINFEITNLGFFHMSRLAINDLRVNQYPLTSSNDKIKLIYNGEIYNSNELREILINLGYSFKSRIDGEVIINGYLEWGDKVWNKLNGIFSVCLIDEINHKVILVRDFLGVKPLFYLEHKDKIIFASELKTIVQFIKTFGKSLGISLSINQTSLNDLFYNMFIQSSENTVYENINSLKPGHFYTFDTTGKKVSKYWDYKDFDAKNKVDSKILELLDHTFQNAVSQQLLSDVPIALALSSGLDSNVLLNTIRNLGKAEINSYSANFVNDPRSEANLILDDNRNDASRINIVDINPLELSKNLDKYLGVYSDLVTLDGGAITTKILSQKMKTDGIKVCLFGEGADELFGGYTWFGLASGVYKLSPKKIREIAHHYAISRKFNTKSQIHSNLKNLSPFKTIQLYELIRQLPNHLLAKVDRSTMSESIEGRVPYLDKNLVEFVLNLDDSFMIPKNKFLILPDAKTTKPVLRNYALNKFGIQIANRPKKGFMLPLDSMVVASKYEIIDLIDSKNFYFKGEEFLKIMDLNSRLKRDLKITVSENWLLWRFLVIQKVLNSNSF